jgi:hypothetical protein
MDEWSIIIVMFFLRVRKYTSMLLSIVLRASYSSATSMSDIATVTSTYVLATATSTYDILMAVS